jgi:RNA polymerase sigma-70 factor (ECF subfamily)
MDESKLIQELQSGNERAFLELVTRYQKMVVGTCIGFVHNQEEAEDIAQEVFIQVFKKVGAFKGQSKISTWLYRIAVNRSLNRLRSTKAQLLMTLDGWIEGSSTSYRAGSRTPQEELENKERAELLHKSIDALATNQRTAFILSKYQGLPNKQIAEVMSTSLSAVEALLNRAKKNLQTSLVGYYRNK